MNPSETAALGERLEAVRGRLAEAPASRGASRKMYVSLPYPSSILWRPFSRHTGSDNGFLAKITCRKRSPSRKPFPISMWSGIASATSRPTRPRTSPGVRPHPHCGQLQIRRNAGPPPARGHPGAARVLQVNIGNEPQKAGVDEHDLPALPKPSLRSRASKCAA